MSNSILVAIDPTSRKIVTVITAASTLPDYAVSHPDTYKLVSGTETVREILSYFGNTHSAGSLLEDLYLNDSCTAVTKKPNMAAIKKAQIDILYNICSVKCSEGLQSSVLGSDHTYPTQLLDQQNLQVSALAATHATSPHWASLLWCTPTGKDSGWDMRPHSAQQVIELNNQYSAFIEKTRSKLRDLVKKINSMPNEATESNAALVRSTFW